MSLRHTDDYHARRSKAVFTAPIYQPEWEPDAWEFPPVLPPEGWVSESRPLNADDRSRLKFDVGLGCVVFGVIVLVMGFMGATFASNHGSFPWFINTLPVIVIIYCLALCLWIGRDTLRILRTMARTHVLVVRFNRPEGANWPDAFSPAFEYLSETRQMWGAHPLEDASGRSPRVHRR